MAMPRWAQSLKTRLAALFFLLFVAILFLSGGFILGEQEHSLLHNIDSSLTARADDLVALLEIDTAPTNLGINRDEDTVAVILDADGAVLVSTDRFGDPAELVAAEPDPFGRGTIAALPSFRETSGTDRMRVVHMIGPNDERIYVAQSLARIDDSLDALQTTLLTVGVLVAVVAGVSGWLIVHRALRPVRMIVERAQTISLSKLDQRLPDPARRDEIGQLTNTLNSMLGRLHASASRQERLIADIAHELRSPLTAVATQLDVGLAHPDDTDWPATADDALDEARRLQHLIDDLLLLSRLDEGNLEMPNELVDLDEVVLSTIARLNPPPGITIDRSAVSAGLVRGDENQLQRAVQNLLDNAIAHATDRVTVGVGERGHRVWLEVADDGAGIEPDELELVFERFYRTQSARDRLSGGTGLGLALTRETIELHGGSITATNADAGGAVFTASFPSTS